MGVGGAHEGMERGGRIVEYAPGDAVRVEEHHANRGRVHVSFPLLFRAFFGSGKRAKSNGADTR